MCPETSGREPTYRGTGDSSPGSDGGEGCSSTHFGESSSDEEDGGYTTLLPAIRHNDRKWAWQAYGVLPKTPDIQHFVAIQASPFYKLCNGELLPTRNTPRGFHRIVLNV